MPKLIRNAVVALAAIVLSTSIAQAQSVGTGPIAYRYESGSIAAGAIITSPAKTFAQMKKALIVCDNSLNGSTTRAMTIKYLEADCATVAGQFTVTCANSGTNGGFTFVQIASDQPGVSTTGLTQLPLDPPQCLQVSVAAAGAVAGQLSIYGR